jgi:hypothetical protein
MRMSSSARFDHGLFDYALRYQRVPGAKYHVRPLSLLQQEALYRCDGRVTVAGLSDMTLAPHPEIRAALTFLSAHGLVKTLMPEAWLFKPPSHHHISHLPTRPRSPQRQPVRIPGFLRRLKQPPQHRQAV